MITILALFALEMSEEFAPIPPQKYNFQHKAPAIVPSSSSDGGRNMSSKKHPFPKYYIEAHAGSSVVVGCSGHTNIGGGIDQLTDMEREIIRYFRTLSLRCQVEIMNAIYAEEEKKAAQGSSCQHEQHDNNVKIAPCCEEA